MNRAQLKHRYVFRYVFGLMALVALAAVAVIVSFYFAYDAERATHDRITLYHVESAMHAERLQRDSQSLIRLLGYDVPSISELSPADDLVVSYGPDARGSLQMMSATVGHLRELYVQHGGEEYAATLDRIEDRYRALEHSILRGDPPESSRRAILVFDLALEQFHRQHSITADVLSPDAGTLLARVTPYASFIATILLATGAIAWFAMFLLRRSVGRQAEMEEALAENVDRLHHLQKLESLGRLVGGIAHDFNNLLTAILGQASLLLDRQTDERTRNGLVQIQDAGRQAASLTRQLLNFGRPQAVEVRVVDLNDVIGSAEEMLRRVIGEDIDLHIDMADDLCPVELDPGQLQQVIINLAINARDAMPEGGRLSIVSRNSRVDSSSLLAHVIPPARYARITVSDSGTGMDESIRERAFEPYFTTKQMGQGTGLGLSTAYGIVNAANGHIEIHSRPGRGTRIEILLPESTKPALPAETGPARIEDLTGDETVLVVEDEQQIRDFLEEGLEALGYGVLLAANAVEGLKLCRTSGAGIDVILADVILPGMNGAEFLGRAQEIIPDAVPILMSGYTDDVLERAGLDESEVPLINKPFEVGEIAVLIRERMAKKTGEKSAALAS